MVSYSMYVEYLNIHVSTRYSARVFMNHRSAYLMRYKSRDLYKYRVVTRSFRPFVENTKDGSFFVFKNIFLKIQEDIR